MTKLALAATLSVAVAAPLAAQTPAEVEREPLVKLLPGETPVDGECLTEQEIDLLTRLEALTRPTVGVEGVPGIDDGIGDDPMPFDPHYFIGTWKIEGVIPESALGEAGEFAGTETIRHVSGCTYESTIEATLPAGPPHHRVPHVLRPPDGLSRAPRGRQPGLRVPQGRTRRRGTREDSSRTTGRHPRSRARACRSGCAAAPS